MTKFEVTESQIQVGWTFGPNGHHRKSAAKDAGYSIGVQIQYKKISDPEFSMHVYPADGSKLPAEKVRMLHCIKASF